MINENNRQIAIMCIMQAVDVLKDTDIDISIMLTKISRYMLNEQKYVDDIKEIQKQIIQAEDACST